MEEHRQSQRLFVEGVEGTLMFATDVDIINISINGVAIRADRRLEIGREYTLKLEFHDKVLSLNGVVVWSVLSELGRGHLDESIPIYKAGIRFTNVISDNMAGLLEFIEENKVAADNRLTVRFDVRSPDRASLNGPHGYRVRQVSDHGMLIETDMPFNVEESLSMEMSFRDGVEVRFVGRVASCIEATKETPKHYDIGIEFKEMSGSDRARLSEFIKSLSATQ